MKKALAFAVAPLADLAVFTAVALVLGILWLHAGWNSLLARLPRPWYEWVLARQEPVFKKVAVWGPTAATQAVGPRVIPVVELFLAQCSAYDITIGHGGALKYRNMVCGRIFRGRSAKEIVLCLWDARARCYLRGCVRYFSVKSPLYRALLSASEIRLVLRAPLEQITSSFVA